MCSLFDPSRVAAHCLAYPGFRGKSAAPPGATHVSPLPGAFVALLALLLRRVKLRVDSLAARVR
jgi:hypothetical protein